uniref:putative nuclease HARBI1 n=1 Tax=Pristiophorus japonicus TaxID=55135 RepID=UPI00398F2A1B
MQRRRIIRHHRRSQTARGLMGWRPYPDRIYRDRRSNLHLNEADCIHRLQFRKEVITEMRQLIRVDIQPRSGRRTVEVKVTAALAFYASDSFQATTGDMCCTSQHATHCCIRQLTAALYAKRDQFINFPMTSQAIETGLWAPEFLASPRYRVRLTVSIILRAPLDDTKVYHNRKQFHSLNIQLVCDNMHQIMAVDAKYPGSIHDAFILRESFISAMFQELPEGHSWLLRHKGYDLATWLVTPLHNPRTEPERRYNMSHITARSIIERTIGILKQRFRCLDHSGGYLQYVPHHVSQFTVVCCMLHNLSMMRGQVLDMEDPPEERRGWGEEEEEADIDNKDEEEEEEDEEED